MNVAYLLLGGNLGNRQLTLEQAILLISDRTGTVENLSAIYETAPWGVTEQPPFYNQVVTLHTHLSAIALLDELQRIELALGRTRHQKWHARTIDIDILYYNHEIIRHEHLSVPHPQLHNRKFTLVPLCEIAPTYQHPVMAKTSLQLLEECPDSLPVKKLIFPVATN